jgi:NADH dehydrogenase FAD-containing subunit
MAFKAQLSDEIERELNDLIKYMTDKGVENVSQEQVVFTYRKGSYCRWN